MRLSTDTNQTTMTTTKAFQVHGKFTPVFFFQTGKVLISPIHFLTAQAALDCQPHDERMAVSRQTFERFNGHRVLIAR